MYSQRKKSSQFFETINTFFNYSQGKRTYYRNHEYDFDECISLNKIYFACISHISITQNLNISFSRYIESVNFAKVYKNIYKIICFEILFSYVFFIKSLRVKIGIN